MRMVGRVREEARKFESRGAHPYHDWDDDDVGVVLGWVVTLSGTLVGVLVVIG